PINTTIPIGDSYNNESHTWFAIIFDNNFDERIGYSDDTADDVLLVNYRQEGAQDAYINGTTTNSMVLDLNMTGQENTDSALSTELDDFNDYIVSYEVVKELDSKDTIGKDISVKEGEPLRYMFIVHQNDTAIYNHTIIDNKITGWNTIKLETVHDYFSYIDELSDINILIYVSDSSNTVERNLTNIVTLIRAYGFNESVKKASEGFEITYDRMKNMDLVILIGSHTDLTRDEIDDMRYYVASGGSLYVLGDTIDHDSKINNLLSNFGFQTYNDTLYSKDIGINSTIEFDMNDMLDLPYFTETNILTNQSIDTIEYQGSAIIFDDDNGTLILGEGYYQFQEGDLYASINKSGEFYIDQVKDGVFNSSEDISLNSSASIQATIELQRGGKLLAFASADIFNSTNILKADNKYLFLRQIQWLLNLQHQISYDNFVVDDLTIFEGDNITASITVRGDENSTIADVQVWIVVLELKVDTNKSLLINSGDGINFNGRIVPDSSIIFMEPVLNTSIRIDVIALIIFISSIGLAVIGGLATKRFKVVKEE
ncbi:MAG: hypothetical protein ACTSPF_15595, partial [Candidatus Heimdallarchaeaceae archaeon]